MENMGWDPNINSTESEMPGVPTVWTNQYYYVNFPSDSGTTTNYSAINESPIGGYGLGLLDSSLDVVLHGVGDGDGDGVGVGVGGGDGSIDPDGSIIADHSNYPSAAGHNYFLGHHQQLFMRSVDSHQLSSLPLPLPPTTSFCIPAGLESKYINRGTHEVVDGISVILPNSSNFWSSSGESEAVSDQLGYTNAGEYSSMMMMRGTKRKLQEHSLIIPPTTTSRVGSGFEIFFDSEEAAAGGKKSSSTSSSSEKNIEFGGGDQNKCKYLIGTSSYEADTEAMAQVKEMIYRAAALRPVDHEEYNLMMSNNEKPKRRKNVRISSDPQTVAARQRRERISERLRVLQKLVPGGSKMDTASMLDEAANYLKFLKTQVTALETLATT